MITKENIIDYIMERGDVDPPIFEIYLIEHANKELIYPTGKHSGFPDTGVTMSPGFYYDLDEAIECMHTNNADIRETMYNAGFILCKFPGMYDCPGHSERIYFVWDNERHGFYEAEEPEIFHHIAF